MNQMPLIPTKVETPNWSWDQDLLLSIPKTPIGGWKTSVVDHKNTENYIVDSQHATTMLCWEVLKCRFAPNIKRREGHSINPRNAVSIWVDCLNCYGVMSSSKQVGHRKLRIFGNASDVALFYRRVLVTIPRVKRSIGYYSGLISYSSYARNVTMLDWVCIEGAVACLRSLDY